MLCGSLPFGDEISEKKIARQTIHDPVPFFPSFWKKLSKEAKKFYRKSFRQICYKKDVY
jgi:hypothetical protein